MPAETHDALLAAALRGEKHAWNALIATHNHRVVVSLLARGVGPERARELAQETWLALILKQGQGQLARLELPGLAVQQACFLAFDDHRKVRRSAEHAQGHPVEVTGVDLEAQFLTEERARRARAVIATCSPSARAIFQRLYAAPDLTHAELAADVGLSVERVKHVVCEIRKKVRLALNEEDR